MFNFIKSFILIIALIIFVSSIKAETYFNSINARWDVSPNQIQYSAVALGVIGTSLAILKPNISRDLLFLYQK